MFPDRSASRFDFVKPGRAFRVRQHFERRLFFAVVGKREKYIRRSGKARAYPVFALFNEFDKVLRRRLFLILREHLEV